MKEPNREHRQMFARWMRYLLQEPDTPAMMLRCAPDHLMRSAGVKRPDGPAYLYAPKHRH